MKVNYDSKPSVYEANGNGSYSYRWNITEVERENEDGTTTISWDCLEVVVWATVTKNKIVQEVIESLWDKDYEQKLTNDYNAAVLGVYKDADVEEKKDAYIMFLAEREAVKKQIKMDCAELNIV